MTTPVTGSSVLRGPGAGAAGSVAGSKASMSVMAPVRSARQRTWTRIPVDTSSGEATSRACRNGLVVPSSSTSAKAKGRSKGCAATGSATHDQLTTVPVGETSTKSVVAACVTGSYSVGGTTTSPSLVRPATSTPSRRPVRKRPRTGPVDRV